MTCRSVSLGLAATMLALCCAAPAHAALAPTGVSCSGHGTGMSSQAGYVACGGAFSGNNLNQAADVESFIVDAWGLTVTGSADISGSASGSSGTLAFAGQSGFFVIALKAGDAFSLYEFDASDLGAPVTSLAYDTLGVGFYSGKGRNIHFGQGLSHAFLYTIENVDGSQDPGVQPGVVPEPSSALLALAGLAALAGRARLRRRHATSSGEAG